MAIIIGHEIIGGIPYINGKMAIASTPMEGMEGVLRHWRCPECKADLSEDGG